MIMKRILLYCKYDCIVFVSLTEYYRQLMVILTKSDSGKYV